MPLTPAARFHETSSWITSALEVGLCTPSSRIIRPFRSDSPLPNTILTTTKQKDSISVSDNAKTHSSVLRRKPVALLQYKGFRRTSLNKWHFYKLYRRREGERQRDCSIYRAKTAHAVPTYISLASPEAGSPSHGCYESAIIQLLNSPTAAESIFRSW